MRLFHVITSLQIGGAEKLMVDILPKMRAAGHDVELLCFYGEKTDFYQRLEAAGVPVHTLGMWKSLYHPFYFWRLFRFLRKNEYDVVHTHNYAPQLFCAILKIFFKSRVMLCTTEHNTFNHRRAWKWYAAIDRRMYSRYDKVICISAGTEKNLRDFIADDSSRILTIPNGIDVEKIAGVFPPSSLGLGADVKTLMQVSRFGIQKDQDTVIRTLKFLPENVHTVFVGAGARRAECEALAEKIGVRKRTHFLGVRMDVPALLKAADVVVMSSHWEGFGLAAAEGMAAGKPVVASDVPGLREVVGGAGLLFPQGDEKALAGTVSRLLDNKDFYEKTAAACSRRALDFDISKMVSAYLKIYKETQTKK